MTFPDSYSGVANLGYANVFEGNIFLVLRFTKLNWVNLSLVSPVVRGGGNIGRAAYITFSVYVSIVSVVGKN